MKKRKIMTLVAVLCFMVVFCAFSALPEVRLVSQDKAALDVTYQGAELTEGTLKLIASFEAKKEGLRIFDRNVSANKAIEEYEIAKDIVVATDANFQNCLELISCIPNGNQYVYEFKVEATDIAEDIYVQPPVLLISEYVDCIPVACEAGAIIKNESEDWFTVDQITYTEFNEEKYRVTVFVTACADALPRFPELETSAGNYGGLAAVDYNEDGFTDGVFEFFVDAASEVELLSLLDSAELNVRAEMNQTVVEDVSAAETSVKSLTVITDK